jgi:hypothetical protein
LVHGVFTLKDGESGGHSCVAACFYVFENAFNGSANGGTGTGTGIGFGLGIFAGFQVTDHG